jgi:hypothetical protein
MAAIQPGTRGRDFTAEELIGRRVRIVGPVPTGNKPPIGHAMMVVADDEMVDNVLRIELVIDPCSVVEAKLTLAHLDKAVPYGPIPTEEVVLRDHVEVSFSAIVSEGNDNKHKRAL